MKTKDHKGFTLIELLVVLAIITLIFSLILASTSSARKRARDNVRIQAFYEFGKALEMYYNQFGKYPCGDCFLIEVDAPLGVYEDSSSSCPFLDGNDDGGPCGAHGPMPSCDGDQPSENPTYGLYRAGLLPVFHAKDPLESSSWGYDYIASPDRQKYLLQTHFEISDKAANDGGICSKRYEYGSGLRDPTLTLPSSLLYGTPCN